jgi:FKBP-type peptidyl-prolyl cis-trans isomerase SlyD
LNIGKDTVVTITYIVRDMEGKLLEESDEPVSYLHGGYDNIFPLVEQALEGKAVGDKIDLKLQPADAFGEYEDELVRLEQRDAFPTTSRSACSSSARRSMAARKCSTP